MSPSLFNGISSPSFVRVDTHSKNYISRFATTEFDKNKAMEGYRRQLSMEWAGQ